MDEIVYEVGVDFVALWPFYLFSLLGLFCHWFKTMRSLRQGGDTHVHLHDYLRDHPYQTLLSVAMCVAGVVVLAEANQMTLAAAFGLGYFSDSATDLIGGRVAKVYS